MAGCRGYVAWVAEDMLRGLPRICCILRKIKSTPRFGLGWEFDNYRQNNIHVISEHSVACSQDKEAGIIFIWLQCNEITGWNYYWTVNKQRYLSDQQNVFG